MIYKPLISYEEWLDNMEYIGKIGSHGCVRGVAELLHTWYKIETKRVGLKTQKSYQVEFDKLPLANQKVMKRIAKRVLELLIHD